jgi:hypothetical protein
MVLHSARVFGSLPGLTSSSFALSSSSFRVDSSEPSYWAGTEITALRLNINETSALTGSPGVS